ncbi:MAG: protein kinase [Flavipsychrobacter sp.]|nr:protein kinase [Flavipsychrobacter sp.]
MTFHGLHNEQYVTGRELGRGGEGTVYELQNHSALVLKKYNEPLTAEKISKLQLMVAMRSKDIEAFAAWPTDLVLDNADKICGFIMKKLTGYVPLHMIFSPMDRKKLFPDKGYNFLVHVARNLATAFYKLHEAGLVVGDVNEGNILISSSGIIAFIDCDSFQVKGNKNYFFCEVGVPRYTPPELLKEGSFEHIIRTVNTDSFSLAVLVFQLLFLGRHPFAGKNRSAADIDEETAIRKHEFAYSLENKKKRLSPPNDSFSITNLPAPVVSLFHQAFEHDKRPAPADWIKALDSLLADMITCSESRLHTYPAQMQECPWCWFKKTRGILYFIDDSYLQAHTILADIESFVNGFHLEKLELEKWSDAPAFQSLIPTPVEKKYRNYKAWNIGVSITAFIACILFYFTSSASHRWMLSCAIFLPILIYKFSPWSVKLKAELSRLTDTHIKMQEQLNKLILEHDTPADSNNYSAGLNNLNKYVHDFRRLPDELERRKKIMEESVYNEQLDYFLFRFDIEGHQIPSFGAAKKTALYNSGIRNAADIHKLQTTKVPGIGPKNIQVLLSWQRQLSTQFVYIPDNYKIAIGMERVTHDIAQIRVRLEQLIRKEYQAVNYLKQNITNRSLILKRQINDLSVRTQQAAIDKAHFADFMS